MEKRPTIKDVAFVASVSTQTVSRVINNRPDVSRATREKILRVIAELKYSPNASARNMRRFRNTSSVDLDGVNLDEALVATTNEVRGMIHIAFTNGAIDTEKAAWLLNGLEKDFIANSYFVFPPVILNDNAGKKALLITVLAMT